MVFISIKASGSLGNIKLHQKLGQATPVSTALVQAW